RSDHRSLDGGTTFGVDTSTEGATGFETAAESYTIVNVAGAPGRLHVSAFGGDEERGDEGNPVTLVTGDFGERNDTLAVESTVMATLNIHGGAGDDILGGGGGTNNLFGDTGSDTFIAGAGIDIIDGGTDPGHTDIDQVTYENSPTGVLFNTSAIDADNVVQL